MATLSASCSAFTHEEKLFRSTLLVQPLQPRFTALQLMAFPKTKITFEKEEISDHRWGSGKYDELMAIPTKDFSECFEQWKRHWENCVRSQGAYFEGDWGISVLHTMFLTFCIFFDKCLYFSYYMAGYFPDSPRMHPWHLIFWLSSL